MSINNIQNVQGPAYTAPASGVRMQENAKAELHKQEVPKRSVVEDTYISTRKENDGLRGSKLSTEAVESLKEHAKKTLDGLVEKMIRAQRKKSEEAQGLDLSSLAQAMGLGANAGIGDIQNLVDGLQLDINVSDMSYSEIARAVGIGTTPEAAAQAISENGMWGVNAVSTRLMDMAVRLSGGDMEKLDELRNAVKKGFEAVGSLDSLPQVCQDTYAETMARFDYWEANGSMEGYGAE